MARPPLCSPRSALQIEVTLHQKELPQVFLFAVLALDIALYLGIALGIASYLDIALVLVLDLDLAAASIAPSDSPVASPAPAAHSHAVTLANGSINPSAPDEAFCNAAALFPSSADLP